MSTAGINNIVTSRCRSSAALTGFRPASPTQTHLVGPSEAGTLGDLHPRALERFDERERCPEDDWDAHPGRLNWICDLGRKIAAFDCEREVAQGCSFRASGRPAPVSCVANCGKT